MSEIDTRALAQILVGTADEEIVRLEARLRAAQLGADVAALNELISDDLLFTGPDGQLGTKAQDLEAYRSGTVKFLAHVPEELRIRRVGANAALAALRTQLTVDVTGNISRGLYRYTRLWAREAAHPWRVVGGHVSRVDSAGEAHMQKWEYTSITWMNGKIYIGHDLVADTQEAIPMPYMQQLGQQGWEMVTAVSESVSTVGGESHMVSGGIRWYFKRPIE